MNLWSEIESVIDHRVFENGSEYLVKIKGLEAHMWVPEVSVSPQLLNVYKVSSLNDSASCLNVYKSKDCTNNQGVESVLINSDIDESFKYRSSIATTCNDALISVKDISTNKKLTHSALQFDKNFLNEKCKTFFFKYGAIKNCEINGTDVSVLHDKLLDRESDVKNLLEDNFLTKSEHNNMELKIAGDSRDSNSLDSNHPPCDNLSDKIEILNVFSSGNDISPSSKDHNDTRLLLNENSNLFLIEPDPVDKEQSNVQFNSFLLDSDKNLLNIEVNSFLEQQSTTALPIEKVNSFLLENVNDDSNTLSLPVPIMQMESLLPKMDENWLPKWPVTDSLLLPNLDSKQLLSSDILGALSHTSANDATDILNPIAAELPSNECVGISSLFKSISKKKMKQSKEKYSQLSVLIKQSLNVLHNPRVRYKKILGAESKNKNERNFDTSTSVGQDKSSNEILAKFEIEGRGDSSLDFNLLEQTMDKINEFGTTTSNQTDAVEENVKTRLSEAEKTLTRKSKTAAIIKLRNSIDIIEESSRLSSVRQSNHASEQLVNDEGKNLLSEINVILRRKRNAERMRLQRASETPEQASLRRFIQAERKRQSRANETPEEATVRREKEAQRKRELRAKETPEEAAIRRKKNAESKRIRRSMETDEEAASRRKKAADRWRQIRASETPEETAVRRQKAAERWRHIRANETPDEAVKRKERDAQRYSCKRQKIIQEITEKFCPNGSVIILDIPEGYVNVDISKYK